MGPDLTVIILTFNEERNLGQALQSVCGWARQVAVLDSFSRDRTLEVAAGFDCQCFQHRFCGYSEQRNYALEALPIATEWVLFLDADEWVPAELAAEITAVLSARPVVDGFCLRRRFYFMGRWIRHGYYGTWLLRLFRAGHGRCEQRGVNEHIVVDGPMGYLRGALIHESHKGIDDWIDKHNRYATLEARELMRGGGGERIGGQAGARRIVAEQVWRRLPPLWRPAFYFIWRYFIRGGFLDGWQGFAYHFLQAFWFRLLIDLKYLEMRRDFVPQAAPRPGAVAQPELSSDAVQG
jgi:glycosyltransferase involved in cell wall biosynthesis